MTIKSSMLPAAVASTCLCLAVASLPPESAHPADSGQPLLLERSFPLPDVSGRIDHMAMDLARKRLLIAELGNDSVDVLDIETGSRLHRIAGLREPQGVAYAAGADTVAVANADGGAVDFFAGGDFARQGQLGLEDDADNVREDPRSGALIVGYGAGGLALLDPSRRAELGKIALPAHPESFQIDPGSNRAFVNIPDAGEIAIVDLAAGKLTGRWAEPGLAGNFPMALDAASGTLAVVFRAPPRLVLLDSRTDAQLGSYETCADADDVFFDAERRRLYVSCGEGLLDVFGWDAGEARRIARIPTSSGARTSLFVPELDRLFVAARAGLLGSDAAILVFRPH